MQWVEWESKGGHGWSLHGGLGRCRGVTGRGGGLKDGGSTRRASLVSLKPGAETGGVKDVITGQLL